MSDYRVLPAGDTALVVELGDAMNRQISARVLALARLLNEIGLEGVIETVPTFRSLMVHYDPAVLAADALASRIGQLIDRLQVKEGSGRSWRLPVCYDANFAPDLEEVAARTSLSPAQVIERHSAVGYHVYMLGFLPGQAYMGDLPAELALARRQKPRPRIAAGSLAIATTMTCIFPFETPCGWHLIGRSPVRLWNSAAGGGALLAPGDQVTFTPISVREYARLLAQAVDGAPMPLAGHVGAAA